MNIFTKVFPEEQNDLHRVDEFTRLINSNSQSFLLNFPAIPLNKLIYGCYEANAQFNYGITSDFDKNLHSKHELPVSDHIIDILAEIQNQPNPSQQQQSGYLIERQPLAKRLLNKFWEHGLIGVCEDINNMPKNNQIPNFIFNTAGVLMNLFDIIYAPINPLFTTNRDEDSDFDNIKGVEWRASLIRAFQWHPYCNKYAVAFKTDLIKIYSSQTTNPVVLKHQKQVDITCIAWKPYYNSIIAIGCAKSIIIWDIDVVPVSIKPSSSCSFVLSRRYHRDIMDIQWSEEFLLSIASKDNQIIIWDVTLKKCMPIKRVGMTGFSLARFSPSGFKLFTADLSTTFRCWNPVNYTSEKWSYLVSRCNAACWSPDGSILLFTCENCSYIYSLRFIAKNKQELKIICDLSSIMLSNTYDEDSINETMPRTQQINVGGYINDMAWDSSGQRLAVSFKKTQNESLSVVAVFITKIQPQFQILPCGFITDMDNSWPVTLNFKPNFEQGALLTIGWANARIQHVPFYFAKLDELNYFN